MNNKSNLLLALAAAALLAACGGGGSSEPVADAPPANGVPDSASASIAGMAAWVNRESGTSSDSGEPLDVTTFNPPVADDIEPLGWAI